MLGEVASKKKSGCVHVARTELAGSAGGTEFVVQITCPTIIPVPIGVPAAARRLSESPTGSRAVSWRRLSGEGTSHGTPSRPPILKGLGGPQARVHFPARLLQDSGGHRAQNCRVRVLLYSPKRCKAQGWEGKAAVLGRRRLKLLAWMKPRDEVDGTYEI